MELQFFRRISRRIISNIGAILDRTFANPSCYPIIVSNNCWGASLYSNVRMEYITPFVGLYILPKDYVRLVSDFDRIITHDIDFYMGDKCPVGNLSGIKIYFLHYKSVDEARSKFERRMKRLKKERENRRLLFKFCDVDFDNSCKEELIYKFHCEASKIGRAISFSKFDINIDSSFKIKKSKTPNGKELFNSRYLYLNFLNFIK